MRGAGVRLILRLLVVVGLVVSFAPFTAKADEKTVEKAMKQQARDLWDQQKATRAVRILRQGANRMVYLQNIALLGHFTDTDFWKANDGVVYDVYQVNAFRFKFQDELTIVKRILSKVEIADEQEAARAQTLVDETVRLIELGRQIYKALEAQDVDGAVRIHWEKSLPLLNSINADAYTFTVNAEQRLDKAFLLLKYQP